VRNHSPSPNTGPIPALSRKVFASFPNCREPLPCKCCLPQTCTRPMFFVLSANLGWQSTPSPSLAIPPTTPPSTYSTVFPDCKPTHTERSAASPTSSASITSASASGYSPEPLRNPATPGTMAHASILPASSVPRLRPQSTPVAVPRPRPKSFPKVCLDSLFTLCYHTFK